MADWDFGLGDALSGLFGGGGSSGGGGWTEQIPSGGGFDPGPEGGGTGSIPGASRTDGGIPQIFSGGGMDWTKIIPALIPAATSAIGLMRGQGGSTDKAIKAMQKSTGPLQAAGNEQLAAYRSGKLTDAQQAKVDEFKKQNLAKWRQYLANAGIPEGSAMADIEAKVNQDAAAYAQQLLQQDFNNAYQATGLTSSNLGRIAQMQAMQDEQQRREWAAFMQAMGQLGTQIPEWFS